jgi:capsular polysaccharide biosynthesis protein
MNSTDHPQTTSRVRLWPMLRRRSWLLALTTAAVVLAAYAVTSIQEETKTAQALAVVPAGATSDAPGSANDAEQLAATYAALIPQDARILRSVGRQTGLAPRQVERRIDVVNTSDTALLELRYRDPEGRRAVEGARALARAVDNGTSPNIPRKTLNPVRLPDDPLAGGTPGGNAAWLLAGLLAGLFLGGVLMLFLERADSRADADRDVEDATGLPATSLGRRSAGAETALVERWDGLSTREPSRVAFVPVSRRAERVAGHASASMAAAARRGGDDDGSPELVIEPAAGPGREPSGESVGLSSDVVVLVARKGEPLRRVTSRLAQLRSLGIEVERTLVVSPRRRRSHDRAETRPMEAPLVR